MVNTSGRNRDLKRKASGSGMEKKIEKESGGARSEVFFPTSFIWERAVEQDFNRMLPIIGGLYFGKKF